jgi:class 3 adenylate cyclase
MEPERLIKVINGYWEIAARAINKYEGVIDKYMGDAIMAEFNTTLNPQEDHVWRAVRAALMMMQELTAYHTVLPEERRFHFGLGVHCGDAVVGNVGTYSRKVYSALGDAVNLAKRLQEVAEPGQILISHEIYEPVCDWVEVNPLGAVQVKNRTTPVMAYELLGLKEGAP